MTPVFQTILHDPENGQYGNCMQAIYASYLDLPLEDVPHFLKDNPCSDELWPMVDDWLKSKGYARFVIIYSSKLDDLQGAMQYQNKGIYYILAGISPRGVCHTVIGMGNKIVHDPHPEGGGLIEPCEDGYYWVEVLTPFYEGKNDLPIPK